MKNGRGSIRRYALGVLCATALLLGMLCMPASAEKYDVRALGEYFGQWGFALAFYNQKCEFSAGEDAEIFVITDGWEEEDNGMKAGMVDHLMLDFPPSPYALHYSEDQDTLGLLLSSGYIKEEPWILKIQSPGVSVRALAKNAGSYYRFDFPAEEMLRMIDEMMAGQTVVMYIESDAGTSELIIGEDTTAKLWRMLKIVGNGMKYAEPDADEYMMGALLPNPADIVSRPRITMAPAQGGSGYPWEEPAASGATRITPKPTRKPTPTPTFTPKPTPTPTATPDPWGNVPEYLRRTYSRGDSGDNVQYIKRRMRYLGYYRRGSNIDGKFNDLMAERLQEFQRNNGLPATGVADRETLVKLFQGAHTVVHGEFYEKAEKEVSTDGRITLVLQNKNASAIKSGDKLKFRVQVKNTGKSKTVTAFELYVYTTDIWGDRMQPDNRYYTVTTEKTIKPGATAYSDYIYLPDRSRIDKVHVHIENVRYKDGSIEEVYVPDTITWTID